MFNFLVTGANFINKGAQSLLFITVDQLRKRYPDCNIFMLSAFDYMLDNPYTFEIVSESEDAYRILQKPFSGKILVYGKELVKQILRRKSEITKKLRLSEIFPSITALIDISGYNLSSDWDDDVNLKYLRRILEAKKRGIPVILMPQSFGPFDYDDKVAMISKIHEALEGCKVLARENAGKKLLESEISLKDVRLYPDLVLTHPEPQLDALYREERPTIRGIDILPETVAIVPNVRTVKKENESALLECYRRIVEVLLISKKNVVVIRHSREDLDFCRKIKALFVEEQRIHLIEEELSCFEYDECVRKIDFVIGSRYHSLVHALKRGVPCIALGWAVKYQELFELFGDGEYVFNVREQIDTEKIVQAVRYYCCNSGMKKAHIVNTVSELMKKSCFDELDRMIG